jgi:hypothetical protein
MFTRALTALLVRFDVTILTHAGPEHVGVLLLGEKQLSRQIQCLRSIRSKLHF